jgi:hypothetical protein
MTKTQLKKETTKRVINHLIEEFDAYNLERENQYFEFWADIDGFEIQLQLDTRDYSVASWDSVKLVGDGWKEEQINKQIAATILEERIEQSVRELVAS